LWAKSVEIGLAWEEALAAASTPKTRKVALRSAMTMSPDRGGIFAVLATLARRGLGGTQGDGRQYVSWIHEHDFVAAIDFLIARDDLSVREPERASTAPNKDFFAELRRALGVRVGLPAPAWLLELGAIFMRTETELVLKAAASFRVGCWPQGSNFVFPTGTPPCESWRRAGSRKMNNSVPEVAWTSRPCSNPRSPDTGGMPVPPRDTRGLPDICLLLRHGIGHTWK